MLLRPATADTDNLINAPHSARSCEIVRILVTWQYIPSHNLIPKNAGNNGAKSQVSNQKPAREPPLLSSLRVQLPNLQN